MESEKWDSITLNIQGQFHSQMPYLQAQAENGRSNEAQPELKRESFINSTPSDWVNLP